MSLEVIRMLVIFFILLFSLFIDGVSRSKTKSQICYQKRSPQR